MRALVVDGGPAHPFAETTPMLVARLAEAGFEARATTEPNDVVGAVDAGVELLVLHCLRWPMDEPARYRPQRAELGFRVPGPLADAVGRHLGAGRGVVGLHAAVISFGDWPGWGDLLGAAWRWEVSRHPPYGPCRIEVAPVASPLTQGLSSWDTVDETYGFLERRAPLQALLTAAFDGVEHPLLWAREHGGGRVAYLGLGHGVESHADPTTQELQRRCARWAAGALA